MNNTLIGILILSFGFVVGGIGLWFQEKENKKTYL